MNGRVCWSWASMTSSGSAANDCGSGQRRRNPAAPSAKHRFPRPRAASQPAYWLSSASAAGGRAGSALAALAGAGIVEGGADVRRGQVDIAGRGIDMIVAHQCLDDRQVGAGLGQRGPERMPQRVRVAVRHARPFPVIPEHGPQPLGGERASPVRSLGHDEQPVR